MAHLRRRALAVVAVLTASLLLSACGTSAAVAQARTACTYVDEALTIYRSSQSPTTPPGNRAALASRAMAQLLRATPYAASATSTDGGWNPLMTTINEAERVPLRFLIPSLTHLCAIAQSPTPYL